MPEPEASAAARELYGALEPAFTAGDSERDWISLRICMAICAGRIDLLHELLIDDITNLPAWAKVMDPQSCPETCLPYLAQFSGAILTPEMSEAARRAAIEVPEAFSRGRLASLEAVVKRRLTGTKYVKITERYSLSPWRVRIETLEAETPDPEAVEADIKRYQLPIGIVLFLNTRVNWVWGEAKESLEFPTWKAVKEGFATWADYRSFQP